MTSPKTLMDLPIELISMILLYDLSLCDLANIRLQNKHLQFIADNIIRKNYCKAINTAALLDSLSAHDTHVLERFAKLRHRENAWTYFRSNVALDDNADSDDSSDDGSDDNADDLVPEMTFRSVSSRGVKRPMCDFNGNYLMMGVPSIGSTNAITVLYYCRLPSSDQFSIAEEHAVLCANAGEPNPKTTFRCPHRRCVHEEAELDFLERINPSPLESEEDSDFIDDTSASSASSSESGSEENALSLSLLMRDADVLMHDTDRATIDAHGNSPRYDLQSTPENNIIAADADEDAMMNFIDWDACSADFDAKKSSQSANTTMPKWIQFPFSVQPLGNILGFKLAAEESSVLALVTIESPRSAEFKCHLYLYHFPSGGVHPCAALPHINIPVQNDYFDTCCIQFLNGKLGVLLSTFRHENINGVDKFFLFDWQSGVLLMTRAANGPGTYYRFCFLSDDYIIFPNSMEWRIELCSIRVGAPATFRTQGHPKVLATTLVLALPEPTYTTNIFKFCCNTEQPACPSSCDERDDNATSNSSSFRSSFADGLVVFNCSMSVDFTGETDCVDVKFVIHKQALLELLLRSSRDISQLTGDVLSNKPVCLDWPEWGPSRTRWLDIHGGSEDFTPLTWGQRVVIIQPRYSHHDCRPIHVYNFNPATVSTAISTRYTKVVTSPQPLNLNENWIANGTDTAFQERVWSELPYIKSESPFCYGQISGAVMDGDQIILFRSGSDLMSEISWIIVLNMT